jgi:hypothetical protein
MRVGLLLDNCPIVATVPNSSIDKLVAMSSSAVGMLWTLGTHHRLDVYTRCERRLPRPLYIIRIGGHKQTVNEWFSDARDALAQVPDQVLIDGRVVLTCGNEPNLEGWVDDPVGYGNFYKDVVSENLSIPVLFGCPSLGVANWQDYLSTALMQCGKPINMIANLYAYQIGMAAMLKTLCTNLYVGEVNRLSIPRISWLHSAFNTLHAAGVKASLIFIAGGQSGGSWDEGYIISEEEAKQLKWGGTMEWKLAFANYANTHPEVGTPTTDIMYDDQGNAWQYSDKGMLFSAKGLGWEIFWFPKA